MRNIYSKSADRTVVAGCFSRLFPTIQGHIPFNFADELEVFCLRYLFLGALNLALDKFRHMWNNHIVSTTSRTPEQMQVLFQSVGIPVDIDELPEVDEMREETTFLGVDEFASIVVVPEIYFLFAEDQLAELHARFPPLVEVRADQALQC